MFDFFKKYYKKEEKIYKPPFFINKSYAGKIKKIEEAPEIIGYDVSAITRQKVTEIYNQVDTLVLNYLPDKTLLKLKQKIDDEYKRREILRNMPQTPFGCKHYTPQDNLNLTCRNEKRCLLISYEHKCKEYEVDYVGNMGNR